MTTTMTAASTVSAHPGREARVTWPHYWDLKGDDLAQAVAIAGDPATPEWELAHLPSGHVAVLDALLARPRQSRASRKAVYTALRYAVMLAGTGAERQDLRMLAWAYRIVAASWLTERRFRALLPLAALHGPLLLLVPVLARHRLFSPAFAGALVDDAHDHRSEYETVNAKEVAINAVRDLGGTWESYAAVFYAALARGHGMSWHRGWTFERLAQEITSLDNTQRVVLAQLMGGMLHAELPDLIGLARIAGDA